MDWIAPLREEPVWTMIRRERRTKRGDSRWKRTFYFKPLPSIVSFAGRIQWHSYLLNTPHPSPYICSYIPTLLKLILRNPLTHRTRRAHPPSNHLQQVIHIIRARPLLMRHHINLVLHFRLLHQFSVSLHAVLRKRLGELV